MKKWFLFVTLFILIMPSFPPIFPSVEGKTISENLSQEGFFKNSQKISGGARYNIQGWVYVQITGSPYERGYQYGYLLSEEIIDLMNRWSKMIHNHPHLKPLNRVLSQQQYDKISSLWWTFCTSLAEQMYWKEYPDEYQQEIEGIAAGVTAHGGTLYGNPITYRDVLASNEMYEILSKLTDRKIRKGIHPLLSFYNVLKPEISAYTTLSADQFIEAFTEDPFPMHHHCSSFIATGNATTDGQIIISNSMWSSIDGAGMWWWSYYIAIRWNILLDVIPTEGHRFQMTCAPGYIWSNHDFYQNDAGIVFIETTLPQGLWRERGLPLAVRARKAVQYAESIDDVISFLKQQNDGVMNAVWLIGDTKTGEIARYELGLFHDAIIDRTFNGFHWSSNNPMDFWVRLEKMDWRLLAKRLFYYVFFGLDGYQYHTPRYHPASRDLKFQELGEKYYGEIDVDVVKTIMATDPIGTYSPDCKITSSSLVENHGMWVFTGNPGGKILDMANFNHPNVTYEKIHPVGWVRIYGRPENLGNTSVYEKQHTMVSPTVQWSSFTGNATNDFSSSGLIVEDILYETTSSSELLAINLDDGMILWKKRIGGHPTIPVHYKNRLFIGTDSGLKMIDLGWMTQGEKPIGKIVSPPQIINQTIYTGNAVGDVYAFDIESGVEQWHITLPGEIHLSNPSGNMLFITSGKQCYAIDGETGNVQWEFETNGIITVEPFVHEGIIYFGSWDSMVYAVYATNGSLKWKYQTGWGVETTPVVSEGLVFVGSHDNNLYALNKETGEDIWVFSCNAGIHSSPVVSNGHVLFGSDDGRLYMVTQMTGDLVWTFSPGFTIDDEINYFTTPIISSPVVKNNIVYLGAMGNIYALISGIE